MAMVKLNVFHWHVTDSNSWPLDLDRYPELAAKGAYSRSETYSQKDIRMIIDYAGHVSLHSENENSADQKRGREALTHSSRLTHQATLPLLLPHIPPSWHALSRRHSSTLLTSLQQDSCDLLTKR